MRRISVIGCSCSGKTTVARALAARLDLSHIELDGLHYELFQERVRAALAAAPDGWVVDGNYFGKLGTHVLEQADTVVWLDVPYRTVVLRVLWRTWSRLVTRADLWSGNRERLRDTFGRKSIVWYVLTTHRSFAAKWTARLDAHPQLDVVRLHSPRDARDWLQSIQASATTSASSTASERQKTPPFVDR
jgi:adenylate kinase family enzyme